MTAFTPQSWPRSKKAPPTDTRVRSGDQEMGTVPLKCSPLGRRDPQWDPDGLFSNRTATREVGATGWLSNCHVHFVVSLMHPLLALSLSLTRTHPHLLSKIMYDTWLWESGLIWRRV